MRFDLIMAEMARPPRTRHAAIKRTMVLPVNANEAKIWIDAFWAEFLSGNPGAMKCAACKPPSAPFDEIIEISSAGKDRSFRMWLDWHASVTFRLAPGISYSMIATTGDTPGTYRFDFVLLGQKKAVIDALREKVSQYIKNEQSKIKSALSPKEQAEFERIGVSMKSIAHSEKTGFRKDDKLIGRMILDRVPLAHLPQKASELRGITMGIGDIILDALTLKENSDVKLQEEPLREQLANGMVRYVFHDLGVTTVGREVNKDYQIEFIFSVGKKEGSGTEAIKWLNKHYEAIVPRAIISQARGFWNKMFTRGLAVPYRKRYGKSS